jgi:hypothetical protein
MAAAAALENPRGAVPERYLPKVPPAAVLAQGELDAAQLAVADPPCELRDVLRAVALDLSSTTSHRFAQIVPYGDLVLSGQASPMDDAGKQTLRFKVAGKPLSALPGDEPFVRSQFLERLCDVETSGAIVVERTIDRSKGLVREFAADASLVLAEGKQRFRKLRLLEQWTFVAVHENQDPAFRARVGQAVRSGTAWLQKAISGASASFLQDKDEKPPRSFGSGRLALAIQTLEHADVPATDPSLVAAWAELERRELIDTYALGTALMALAARHAPPREAEMLHDGTLKERPKRQLPPAQQALAARWVERLLSNVDKRTDPANCLRFNYTAAARFDTSVQQYGLLGLDAAELCGVPIPPTAWAAAAKHLLAVQSSAHGRVHELSLQSHADAQASRQPPSERIPTRGFSYKDEEEPAYGSMTAAGALASPSKPRATQTSSASTPPSTQALPGSRRSSRRGPILATPPRRRRIGSTGFTASNAWPNWLALRVWMAAIGTTKERCNCSSGRNPTVRFAATTVCVSIRPALRFCS